MKATKRQIAALVAGKPAPMTEAELQDAVIALARLRGWRVSHFRPARTAHGWRTAVSGDGKGFPDLVLIRGNRIVWAELKSDTGTLSEEQEQWRQALLWAGADYRLWRPSAWPAIQEALK